MEMYSENIEEEKNDVNNPAAEIPPGHDARVAIDFVARQTYATRAYAKEVGSKYVNTSTIAAPPK